MHNIFTIQNIQYQPEDLEMTVFFIPYKVLNVKLELGSTCPVQLPHWCVQSVTHGTISHLFLFHQDTFLTIHLLWKLNLIPNRSKNKHDGVTRPGLVISGKESGEIQFGPVRCSWFSPVPLTVQWSLICALSTPHPSISLLLLSNKVFFHYNPDDVINNSFGDRTVVSVGVKIPWCLCPSILPQQQQAINQLSTCSAVPDSIQVSLRRKDGKSTQWSGKTTTHHSYNWWWGSYWNYSINSFKKETLHSAIFTPMLFILRDILQLQKKM